MNTEFAILLGDHLRKARLNGTVTEAKPITSTRLVKIYNEPKFNWDISASDIREMIHFLRMQNHDIGSSSKGYWFILESKEYEESLAHQRSRIREQAQVYRKQIERREILYKKENSLDNFTEPERKVFEKLNEEFDLQLEV